jgi:hypothetical protein
MSAETGTGIVENQGTDSLINTVKNAIDTAVDNVKKLSFADLMKKLRESDEQFRVYMIMTFIFVIIIIFISYMIHLSRLQKNNVKYMNTLYPTIDGNLRPINSADPDCSGNLYDYYIKSAYNACSGGGYKNDFVDIDVLKSVIKQGVRCLDFEIYSINNKPVVATSTSSSYHVKETFNSVDFALVMSTINNYAFSSGTTPNASDPLLIHLRCMSNNQNMYSTLASIFKTYTSIMLGPTYSYEVEGTNLGKVPLLLLKNKVILIIDRSNTAFLENQDLLEYVNMTSNSVFMRLSNYYNIKNNPDINELTEFNKQGMTMSTPDIGFDPVNPSGIICRTNGCQMVAMRYQYVDNNLMENTLFFDRAGYAFALKPPDLRYQIVTIDSPIEQNPALSYEDRLIETPYYTTTI